MDVSVEERACRKRHRRLRPPGVILSLSKDELSQPTDASEPPVILSLSKAELSQATDASEPPVSS